MSTSQHRPLPYRHRCKAYVPPFDYVAAAEDEGEGSSAVTGGVELTINNDTKTETTNPKQANKQICNQPSKQASKQATKQAIQENHRINTIQTPPW